MIEFTDAQANALIWMVAVMGVIFVVVSLISFALEMLDDKSDL